MKILASELSDLDKDRVVVRMDELRKTVLPADWRGGESCANAQWYHSRDGIKVLVEVEMQAMNSSHQELWLHLSMSRKDRVPTYTDVRRVKEMFIGKDRKAIQIFPAESEHYNLHPNCLHLWSPLERDPLPDFRTAGGEL